MMEYKYIPPPDHASTLAPSEARALFRRNGYYGSTSAFCSGYSQAGLLVIPESLADDFEEFCRINSGPFPLLYRSKVGEFSAPPLAKNSDVKTDLPRYAVYSRGKRVDDTLDLSGFEQSWSDLVSFYIGCSFNANGIRLKNVDLNLNVSVYLSNIDLKPVGAFAGAMFTTMRPIRKSQLAEAFCLSAQYPDFHGAPIHIGNPARIGVRDISLPSAGDPISFEEDEVPVFWACGYFVTNILADAAPPLAFTHYGGCMFISDIQPEPKKITHEIDIVDLSRPGQPFFASILERKSVDILQKMEKALLDDPGKRGIIHLFQELDLLKAVLSLSHASRVAVTTGFPVHTELEVKEETDGLPGALSICQALLALDKEAVLIADDGNVTLFQSCVNHAKAAGSLKSLIEVIPYSKALEMWKGGSSESPPWDCLVAIERAGRAKDGTYRTMKATLVSVDPVDDIFIMAQSNPLVSTISIGDGGNELGMGKVYEQVVKYIPRGASIACETVADFVIASGVSNWAGYAVSLGLCVVSSSPLHWRYKNHGVDADHTPTFNMNDFVPTMEQIGSLLKHMNDLGISDGRSGSKDQSVDGLPLKLHLEKVTQLINCL